VHIDLRRLCRRVPALPTFILDNLLISVYKKVKFLRKAEATSRNKDSQNNNNIWVKILF
jgi:hypothetical protein